MQVTNNETRLAMNSDCTKQSGVPLCESDEAGVGGGRVYVPADRTLHLAYPLRISPLLAGNSRPVAHIACAAPGDATRPGFPRGGLPAWRACLRPLGGGGGGCGPGAGRGASDAARRHLPLGAPQLSRILRVGSGPAVSAQRLFREPVRAGQRAGARACGCLLLPGASPEARAAGSARPPAGWRSWARAWCTPRSSRP